MTRNDGNDEIRMSNAESVQSVTSVVLLIHRVYWCLFVVCLIILPKILQKSFDAISRFAVKGCSTPVICTHRTCDGLFPETCKIHERNT
jgi:hypothetical protein